MNDVETTVTVDFDKLPDDIGIIRDRLFKGKRVYGPADVPKILNWINNRLQGAPEGSTVLILGGFPTWMAMEVGVQLYKNDRVGVLMQGYPNTAPQIVFDKTCPEVY